MAVNVNEQDYWSQSPQQVPQQQGWQDNFNFEMPAQQEFTQELSFQSFDVTSPADYQNQNLYGNNPYLSGVQGGNIFTSTDAQQNYNNSGSEFEDEPPLLQELGINPDFIVQKTLTVLNPFRTPDATAVQDVDFAGPLVFCLIFGGLLLLSGKVHFSYIYGVGALGCLSVWALLSLMSTAGVTLGTVVTVLGYCILPMVALSGINIILSLQGYIGIVLTSLAILWCSLSASKLFVTALSMDHQQPLVMYPCALLYGVFALITIF